MDTTLIDWIMSKFGLYGVILAALLIYRKPLSDVIFHNPVPLQEVLLKTISESSQQQAEAFAENLRLFKQVVDLTGRMVSLLEDIKVEIRLSNRK